MPPSIYGPVLLVRVGPVGEEVEHGGGGGQHGRQGARGLEEAREAVGQEQEAGPDDVLVAVRARQVDAHLRAAGKCI